MFGAACSCSRVEVEVLAGAAGVAAGDARLGARAGELGLHPHLAAGRAEAERGPVEAAVALDLGALGGEDPGLLGDVLGVDVAQGRGLADGQLDHRVEQRVDLVGGRGPVLPDLRLGALLEHDQRAPVDRGAVRVERQLDPDRLAQPARRGARGRGRRRCQLASLRATNGSSTGTSEPSRSSQQLGVASSSASASGSTVAPSAPEIDRRRAGRLVGVEVEPGEVGEFPALRLLVGEGEALRERGAALAPLVEARPVRSRPQPMEPSICSSISRLSSTAYSIGSSLVTGSMKPLTIIFEASSSSSPRLCR